MVEDNCNTAANTEIGELTEEDHKMLSEIVRVINSKMKVGCTGCRYCMPCPKGVDIPGTFAAYNRCFSEGKKAGLTEYFMCTAMRKDSSGASQCIGCGRCEQHCPQKIEIRQELKNAKKKLEGPLYHIGAKIVKLLKAY
jgi:hypothetical protein